MEHNPKTEPQEVECISSLADATGGEIAVALLLFPLAYVYLLVLLPADQRLVSPFLTVFTLGFVALAELLLRSSPRPRESWLWLGCMAAVLLAIVLDRCRVWEGWALVFLHIFAVWWVLSRAGALVEGESGSLLPLDALHGFITFPFGNFFLRVQTLSSVLKRLRGEGRRAKPETLGWSIAAAVIGCALLYLAADLLRAADEGFSTLLSGLLDALRPRWSEADIEILFRLLFSLPVGAWLYGLLVGAARADRGALRAEGEVCRHSAEGLRKVPGGVWTVLIGLFCLLYALFFVIQARYLFGAFTGMLPEGFIVSEYARRGFFELCRVMAVNFALLWLALRSSRKAESAGTSPLRVLCLLLLAESLLLAVVAFSKLALYISCFGFTPKRLQSTWLVCVLAFGCICAAFSLLRGKKTFRLWMAFGAASLSLLCLY